MPNASNHAAIPTTSPKTERKVRSWLGRILLVVVLLLGGFITAAWAPDRPLDTLKPRWAGPPSQFVEVGGLQVHVRDEGPRQDGTQDDQVPIILIHGTSASLHTWEAWAAGLKDKRRVIRMDLPGFGLTGPNPQNDYSFAAYTQFMTALLDRLGIKRCILVGNSLGGGVAWTTAHALPTRVTKLVLIDSSGYAPDSGKVKPNIPIGFVIAGMPGLRSLMQNLLPKSVIASSLRNVYGDPSKVTPELIDYYYEMALREGNRKALGRRLSQGYTGVAEHIAQLKMPTLILWGGQDRLIAPEFGERFTKDIAGSKLVMFPELGHVPHEEDPKQTLAALLSFL